MISGLKVFLRSHQDTRFAEIAFHFFNNMTLGVKRQIPQEKVEKPLAPPAASAILADDPVAKPKPRKRPKSAPGFHFPFEVDDIVVFKSAVENKRRLEWTVVRIDRRNFTCRIMRKNQENKLQHRTNIPPHQLVRVNPKRGVK